MTPRPDRSRGHVLGRPLALAARESVRASALRTASMLAALAGLLLATSATWLSAQGAGRRATPSRIAVVDTDLLVEAAPQRPEAERRFAEQAQRAERIVQAVADSLRLAVDELTRVQDRLSPPEREAALHLVRAREIHLEDMVRQMEVAVARERETFMKPVMDAVRDAVRHVRQRDGWSAIVERRSLGAVADIDSAIDVTRTVLDELRARARDGGP